MFRIAMMTVFAFATTTFADTKPKPDRNVRTIEGTTWKGEGDNFEINWTYKFCKNGVLEYWTINGGVSTNGTWKQDGKKLTWECSNRYAEYEGTIGKDEIVMKAHNITGLEWQFTLKPVKDPPANP